MKTVFTYRDLLDKMVDLKSLAIPPVPGERGGTFCNYNRDCRYNPETDTYENWSQKGGGSQYFEYKDGDECVLMDMDGPGVIWRVWTALSENESSRLRIYLDGEETPTVDQTVAQFFRLYDDDIGSINFPNLTTTEQSRGWVSYFPITFQKHIKITSSPDMQHQFTYTRYPDTVVLPDFRERFSRENNIAKAELDRLLEDRGAYDSNKNWNKVQVTIPAGESGVLFRQSGAGALSGIRFYPASDGTQIDCEALRKLILRIHWDGHKKVAVWTPLGDFFGAAMGMHRYRTIINGMHRLECYSNWYMPYGNGAEIVLENRMAVPQTVSFEFCTEPLKENPDTLLRFHSKWHPTEFLNVDKTPFMKGGQRYPDWPLLFAKGAGRFCGMSLHVYNNWRDPIQDATSWWYGKWHPTLPYHVSIDWFWGEGREKFFVDGEKMPVCFGTGSEDYIGYSYSAEPPFARWDSPFAAVPNVPLTGKGNTSHCRYQIADNVPFHDGFEAFVEKYKPDYWQNELNRTEHGDVWNCCYFDAICYWYQQADLDDDYPAYPDEQLLDKYHLPLEGEYPASLK